MDIIKDDIDKTDVDYLEINPDDSLHDTCIYESLYDHKTNFGHIDDINYFLDVLDDMSVGIPSVMVEMLQSDKENDVGNEVWQYRYDRGELIMVSELREMPEKTA